MVKDILFQQSAPSKQDKIWKERKHFYQTKWDS